MKGISTPVAALAAAGIGAAAGGAAAGTVSHKLNGKHDYAKQQPLERIRTGAIAAGGVAACGGIFAGSLAALNHRWTRPVALGAALVGGAALAAGTVSIAGLSAWKDEVASHPGWQRNVYEAADMMMYGMDSNADGRVNYSEHPLEQYFEMPAYGTTDRGSLDRGEMATAIGRFDRAGDGWLQPEERTAWADNLTAWAEHRWQPPA